MKKARSRSSLPVASVSLQRTTSCETLIEGWCSLTGFTISGRPSRVFKKSFAAWPVDWWVIRGGAPAAPGRSTSRLRRESVIRADSVPSGACEIHVAGDWRRSTFPAGPASAKSSGSRSIATLPASSVRTFDRPAMTVRSFFVRTSASDVFGIV